MGETCPLEETNNLGTGRALEWWKGDGRKKEAKLVFQWRKMDLDTEWSRWWSGSKKTGHCEMERGGKATTETQRDGRERQMETEEGGGRGVCSSCWCHWGSAVGRLQFAAVQRGGLNQRVPVCPGSYAGSRVRDGGDDGGAPGSERWWRMQGRGSRDRWENSRGPGCHTEYL